MNENIRKLHRIASKKSRAIIGLMSGTSLDGLDIALCSISGSGTSTTAAVKKFVTISYSHKERDRIREVFAREQITFKVLCELNAWVGTLHSSMVNKALRTWKIRSGQVDLIASHGQTVYHAPKATTAGVRQNSTLQVGDGDHLAVGTGIITLSDFRQKHVAAGGEGAPLAVYGDYLLFSRKGEDRIMLNIGGIGNFTYLPRSGNREEVFVTDTGPGNTLIDQVVRHFNPELAFDQDAAFGKRGKVNGDLLINLKKNDFFKLPFPKTTGPEQFNLQYVQQAQKASGTSGISFEDLLATLTRLSAETMSESIRQVINRMKNVKVFLSGGGAHNPLMVSWITELLPEAALFHLDRLGIAGDAKEAVLFAVLANETLAGGKVNFGLRSQVPSVSMGKVSFPI